MSVARLVIIGIIAAVASSASADRRTASADARRAPRLGLDAGDVRVERGQPARVAPEEPPLDESARALRFRKRLGRLLRGARLGDVRVGLVVHDLEAGTDVARRDPNGRYNPASTLKLFTSAVALDRLGPGHRFTTELLVAGDAVVLRGDGDPMLSTGDLQSMVSRAGGSLREAGAFERVIVDATRFEGRDLPPGFGKKQTDASYRASTGAVALDYGTVRIVVTPTRPGRPASVEVTPPGSVLIDNRTQTVHGRASTIQIQTRVVGGRTVVTAGGGIGAEVDGPAVAVRRVAHPPLVAGYALREILRRAGIEVRGAVQRVATPSGARSIARRTSPPLSTIIAAMNKHSNNFIAEMLLRALPATGRPTTWREGQGIVRAWLADLVGLGSRFLYRNGSGLYDGGRFSPRQVVALLAFMDRHPHREAWRDSLAATGGEGTLAGRLRSKRYRGRVIGKTGTLNEVSALSGYARGRSGRLYAFSILMNETNQATALMRRTQDRILTLAVDLL